MYRCYSNRSMARTKGKAKNSSRAASSRRSPRKHKKKKDLRHGQHANLLGESSDQATLQQLKAYEEGLKQFQQQKFARAKQALERVLEGPNKELADRARVHLRISEQRMTRMGEPTLKGAEDHYNQGIAMMNLARWDDAREHLDRAR